MKKTRSDGTALQKVATVSILWVIVVAGIALASAYALGVPPWNNPDEPAHYNYVRHVATTGQLPELKPGDWDAALLERLKSTKFPRSESVDSIAYESHQPPAFYLMASPIYNAAARLPLEERVPALRMLSVVLSGMTVVVAFLVVRAIFPDETSVQLAVAGFVAFLPMRSSVAGSISNDALSEMVAALLLLAMVHVLRTGFQRRHALLVGALLGVALLTKMTVYGYVPLALLVALVASGKGRSGSSRLRLLGLATLVALLIGGWWFVRNGLLYGPTDIFGLQRHGQVVVDQPRFERLDRETLDYFASTLFQSFWGQFGWMGILIDQRIYTALKLVSAAAGFGFLLFLLRVSLGKSALTSHQRGSLALMGLALAVVATQVALYNLSFIQPQGRYLYPALLPIALFFVLGLRELMAPIHERLLLALAVVSLALLNAVCLTRYVIPYFS
ncbi:MAG: ArnT family glycosyltransferase [Sphingomonadaceae bacterium]